MSGARELQDLLVGYAKQETVEPLKTLGKFLGLGIAGALLTGLGFFFIGVGTLRLAQSRLDEGSNLMSLVPYAITLLVVAALIGIVAMAMQRSIKKVNPRG